MKTIMGLVMMAQRAMIEQTGKPATEIHLTHEQFVALLHECDKKYGTTSPKHITKIKLDGVLIVIRAMTPEMVAERIMRWQEQMEKAGYKTYPPFEESVFDTGAFIQQQRAAYEAQAAGAQQQQYQGGFGQSYTASQVNKQQQQEHTARMRAHLDGLMQQTGQSFYNPFYKGRNK